MTNRKNLLVMLIAGFIFSASFVRAQDYKVDESLKPNLTASTGTFKLIRTAAVQADQKVLIGGNFTAIDGVGNSLIARFNADGSRDASFNSVLETQASDEVRVIRPQPDGKILVSGLFRIGGGLRNFVRLNSDGSLDTSFNFPLAGVPRAMEFLPDGKIVACGSFMDTFNGARSMLIRLGQDGDVDPAFQVNFGNTGDVCNDVKLLPGGGMYAAGNFISVNGSGKYGIVKLNADGTTDTSFNHPQPGVLFFQSRVFYKLAVQPDGKVIANYRVDSLDIQEEPVVTVGMRRINPDGSIDLEFPNCGKNAMSTSSVAGILIQNDGRIITNGCSQTPTSASYQFARVYSNGSLDTGLHRVVVSSNIVTDIYKETEKSYLITGTFTTVDGLPRQGIARLVAIKQSTPGDFDGDGKTDIAVFRPSERIWYIHRSTSDYQYAYWGLSTDKPVVADYDNDGKADVTVVRDTGWYILRSSDSVFEFRTFGQSGDLPTTGDINGDGKADMIVRHKVNNVVEWSFRYFGSATNSGTFFLSNELQDDIPVTGDFNGDGKTEVGFYRDGHWYTRNELGSAFTSHFVFGTTGDIPVPGDYDGDSRTDYAVFRPSTGVWYIARSLDNQFTIYQFGASGDIPVPGDYDGDGKTDIGIYRGGLWFLQKSAQGFGGESWGLAGDIPIPAQSISH
jgi:uncharacterized delta-60 repeat protein